MRYLFTGLLKPLKHWIETLCHLKNQQAAVGDDQCKTPSSSLPSVPAFKDILDGRLKDQMKELNKIVLKSNKILYDKLKIIPASQQFMGNKFDALLESFRSLKEENSLLKAENVQLKMKYLT